MCKESGFVWHEPDGSQWVALEDHRAIVDAVAAARLLDIPDRPTPHDRVMAAMRRKRDKLRHRIENGDKDYDLPEMMRAWDSVIARLEQNEPPRIVEK